MSTENEGTAVPLAPSAPPVPVDAPPSEPGATPEEQAPSAGTPDAGSTPPSAGAPWGPGAPQLPPPDAAPQPEGAPTAQLPPVPPGHPLAYSAPESGWPPPAPGAPADPGGGAGTPWGAPYQDPGSEPKNRRGGLIAAILAAALVAGGVGGGVGYQLARDDDSSGSTTVSATSGGDVTHGASPVAAVAARALPSTVTIEAESGNGQGGTGTGFVFDKQGHIITNNHVVADAADGGRLTATFPSGRKYDAEIIGHAQGYDVAVIKLKSAPPDLQPLTLGDSDKVQIGDPAIAIGAPFGLSNTVTSGIISAKHRPVASSDGSSGSKASYLSALQTDASINPGNSGGPLLDGQGAVIGINSAIQSTNSGGFGSGGQSGSIGLGFAIPINQAKYVAQQLIATGKPVYAKIGASVSLEDSSSGAKIVDQGAGADAVEPGGPADVAGLKPGDVITKLDDTVIDSGPTLIGAIWTHKPGDQVTITYQRGGQAHTVELTLGSRVGDN